MPDSARINAVRHRLADRLFHWVMAVSVLVLGATAFLPILGVKFGWLPWHWSFGVVLTAAVLFPEDPNQRTKLSWPRFLQFPSDTLLQGRKVLVVDNLWYQGRTIMAVKGRVESAGGYPELAVIHWKKQSSYFPEDEPDYYAEITEDFIHYPWQRIDDSDYRILAHPVMPLS